MTMIHLRVRHLPRIGFLGRRRPVQIEVDPWPPGWVRSPVTTERAYTLIKPLIGWDEAMLLLQRARREWTGGTGPWVSAFTGVVSQE
ncbi:hypothetical protein BJF80_15935 [Serinicoccus sp. CUA-874]|uniref:hypothetical protein n=1 Tax=unclassified Serinicoccus TaxID=2643101 RepID=UPI000959FF2A|nr:MULTISPECIES: hypothetical protein [unclassified Serinicoccus]OLT18306.1 hypothetical protein BJF80_15935 [Serinicoccus sp. CUA-874]